MFVLGIRIFLIAMIVIAGNMAPAAQLCRDDIPTTAPDSRYRDNGDGTVTDLSTGLIWKKCVEGLIGTDCSIGNADLLTWQDALQRGADAEFAGSAQWRLPNKKELMSLVEDRCVDPAINGTFFPNTPVGEFWSSSPYAPYGRDSNFAWRIRFDGGNAYGSRKYAQYCVRLVSGGQ